MRLTLGENCHFINGGSWTEADYRNEGIPVLKVSNFNSNGFSINDISFLDIKQENKYLKNKLEINDIVIATVGSHPSLVNSAAGRTIRVNKIVENFFLNQNAICLRTSDPNIIDQRFLYLLTETVVFKNFIQQRGKGAANQMRIPISGIKEFTYDFPEIETQRRIASILSGYDDLIENNLKRIKILEEMAQQTYEEWFVRMRFPGASTSLSDRNESETERSRSLPEGWEKVKLIKVCDLVMGQSPKSEHYNDDGKGLPFHQGVKDYGFRFPTNNSWSTAGNKKAIPNSILFSVRAPTGRLNVASEEIILGRGLAAINHKDGLNSFLYYQLRNIFFEDNLIGGGAIYASVTKNDVERIEIISAGKIAEHFNKYAFSIDQEILNLTSQNQRLRELRDLLLPRLMMGMIEV